MSKQFQNTCSIFCKHRRYAAHSFDPAWMAVSPHGERRHVSTACLRLRAAASSPQPLPAAAFCPVTGTAPAGRRPVGLMARCSAGRSISLMKCSMEPGGARLKPRHRSGRSSLAASGSDGGVKPAGRNTGPDWQIFSMAKRSDEAQTADLRHSNLRTAPALLSPCKKRRRLKRRRKDSP